MRGLKKIFGNIFIGFKQTLVRKSPRSFHFAKERGLFFVERKEAKETCPALKGLMDRQGSLKFK